MSEPRTRDRVVDVGLRLFADRGYAGTTVADIEAAAGLSPGSGSLYRHFPSKRAVLEEGIRRRVADSRQLLTSLADLPPDPPADLVGEAAGIVRTALHRLDAGSDLNRLMLKDLNQFPELMAEVSQSELAPIHLAVAAWIQARSRDDDDRDPAALAAVLVGATAHFWLLQDAFGTHPAGVDQDAFIAALAQVAVAILAPR